MPFAQLRRAVSAPFKLAKQLGRIGFHKLKRREAERDFQLIKSVRRNKARRKANMK